MNYTPAELEKWDRVRQSFQEQYGKTIFENTLAPFSLYRVTYDKVYLTCEDDLMRRIFSSRYKTALMLTIRGAFGSNYDYTLLTNAEAEQMEEQNAYSLLNPRFTFDNFVSIPSNTLAMNAARAVAEMPGTQFNPLYIHGSVGLGKTHLMNAIGNYILSVNPLAKVLLTTAEQFTNDLIASIRTHSQADLKQRFRNVDVLMIDDIQHFQRVASAQDEFFFTYNTLITLGKQLVFTADCPPHQLTALHDRMVSRLSNGLTVAINKPDFEGRMAILKNKADEDNVELPDDVAEFIARNIDDSIRHIEGALTSVTAVSRLLGVPITVETAKQALADSLTRPVIENTASARPPLDADTVLRRVAEWAGVSAADIKSTKRVSSVNWARQVTIYLLRELLDMSYEQCGKAVNRNDHTTAMNGYKNVIKKMDESDETRLAVTALMDALRRS